MHNKCFFLFGAFVPPSYGFFLRSFCTRDNFHQLWFSKKHKKPNKTRWNHGADKTECANRLAVTSGITNSLFMCCSAKEFFNLDPICDVRSWLSCGNGTTGRWHHLPETFGPTSLNGLHLTSKVAHCCGEDGNEVGVYDWLPSDVDGMPFKCLPPNAPTQTQNEILGGLTRSKHFRIASFEHKQIHLFELVGNLHLNTKPGCPGLFLVEIPKD